MFDFGLFLMKFTVHLKGKETHLFCSQRIEQRILKIQISSFSLIQSIKALGDAQSEALTQDKLTELMKVHHFPCQTLQRQQDL